MKTHIKLHIFFFLGLALIFCAALVRPTRAAPQGTIQDMISAAADGDSLDIPPGTYTENLTINNNITLRGANRATTIIQAADGGLPVISANSNKGLHLENLTIQGGHPTGGVGGGVYAAGGTLEIINCRITGNSAAYGGGVFLADAGSSLVLSGSTVDNNTAQITGGGVYAAGSATLANTTLDANTANNHGGGLHANSSANLTGGAVSSNHALNGNGGGVNVNDGLTVSGTIFTNNTAAGLSDTTGSGGAITQWNSGQTVSITGAVFSGNSAQVKGGAVFIRESFLSLSGSYFSGNTVDSGTSGGDVYGGGVYAGGGLDGSGLTFNSNSAICTGCNFMSGGGLYIQRPITGPSTVSTSTFDGNLAWFGSGISSASSVQLTLTNASFTNNGALIAGQPRSGYGGGVGAYWVHGDQLLFQNNKVLNSGGGLDASHIVLTHSRFITNTASVGGGGVYANVDFNGSNLLFAENSSSSGAAVHVKSGAALTFYNVTIARPAQAAGPAIDLEANTTLNLDNSIVNNYTNAITFRGSGSLKEDYNLFYNNGIDVAGVTPESGGHSTGLLPPGFVNPAAGDYHLKPNSKAIGAGYNFGLADDLDGRLRLSGRNDAGAYQFWASTFVPLLRR